MVTTMVAGIYSNSQSGNLTNDSHTRIHVMNGVWEDLMSSLRAMGCEVED